MTWPIAPLRDLIAAPLANGRSVPDQVDGFPVLRLTALRNGAVDLRQYKEGAWTRADAERFLVRAGDFLVSRGNGSLDLVGRGGLVVAETHPVAFPDTMIRVRPDTQKLEPHYLSLVWGAPSVRSQIEGSARTTAGIYKINQGHLGSVTIPVPPLDEQGRIVDLLEDLLSRLDAADAYLTAVERKREALWLSSLSILRRSLADAKTRPIGDVADTALGKMLDAKRQVGTPTPYLRNINVRWREFNLSDLKLTPLTDAEVQKYDLRPGDILACEGGEPGRCAVWTAHADRLAYQKALHRIRIRRPDEILPDFLALMLEEAIRAGRADRLFTGTTIKHLPQEKLRTIDIPVPELGTQRRIIEHVANLLAAEQRLSSAVAAATQRAAALRRSLLTAAFSGRLTGEPDLSEVEEMIGA